jgi:hypothetical protein
MCLWLLFLQGVLTVTIFKSAGLTMPGSLLSPDPYAEVILVDCDRRRCGCAQDQTNGVEVHTPCSVPTGGITWMLLWFMTHLQLKSSSSYMMDIPASYKRRA